MDWYGFGVYFSVTFRPDPDEPLLYFLVHPSSQQRPGLRSPRGKPGVIEPAPRDRCPPTRSRLDGAQFIARRAAAARIYSALASRSRLAGTGWSCSPFVRAAVVVMMATHHDALWAKLHELELQLAAYKLLRAARVDDDEGFAFADGAAETPGLGSSTCRGRQYDAYMRRRDARRVAASAEQQQQQQAANSKAQQPRGVRAAGRATPMSPRSALRCAARDAQEAGATPRLVIAPAKRTPAVSSIPSTPRRDGAALLPRSRTVSGGATGSPARPSQHQRRNSLGVLAEFGECATPRPFLRRGTGTGGAAAPARLRTTRVHDLPTLDVAAVTPRPLLPQQQQQEHSTKAPRHVRSVSELPFDTAALASPQARARKRWGSPERPTAMFSAADSHRDLSKGLKKLLSFVRKGGRSGGGDQAFPAPSPRGSGKPVSKGWSGCSHVDVPFDRASLDGHRFPMTRAVGISG